MVVFPGTAIQKVLSFLCPPEWKESVEVDLDENKGSATGSGTSRCLHQVRNSQASDWCCSPPSFELFTWLISIQNEQSFRFIFPCFLASPQLSRSDGFSLFEKSLKAQSTVETSNTERFYSLTFFFLFYNVLRSRFNQRNHFTAISIWLVRWCFFLFYVNVRRSLICIKLTGF